VNPLRGLRSALAISLVAGRRPGSAAAWDALAKGAMSR
jgi:hypothetical protein